jgi:hypothetical protein
VLLGELARGGQGAVLVARCVDGRSARLDLDGFSRLGLEVL